jgi:hypothetical protein
MTFGATEAGCQLASRIYVMTRPFRKRVKSAVSSASVSAEIDSIGAEIQAAAKADDKMKVGAGD